MSSMSQAQPQGRPESQSPASAGVSMRDLLASCAAATAVSTPPRAPEPEARRPVRERPGHRASGDGRDHREAA
ncbi:hypothetical protein B9W64_14030 [Streptomyces sp. CS159]|uniref:hypothetical protein n=1 Tax=Streptomyces sp. CS159 TaxID=1982762 RepID=UPI000B40F6F3|nr:hypothetical protein [Streptomyces sp. CS159]OWA15614.1 hypothetical protein B9W64_14030 [Streptomyces sp. CS159]